MSSRVYSDYFHELPQEAKKQYEQKLDMLGPMANDPYAAVSRRSPDLWSTDAALWPKGSIPTYTTILSARLVLIHEGRAKGIQEHGGL